MAREINLVPDIKGEMIKALKLRNFIFFLCIIVAGASVAVVLFFATIVGGQNAAISGKQNTLDMLSTKINSYSDLSDFLTVKDQLGSLSNIADNKRILSRSFGVLSALLPKNADRITISELTVDLAADNPTLSFDAHANAGEEPFYDYRVLDAFQKSMPYMRYDYGDYVDRNGNTIPAYCIIESGNDGATFSDPSRGYYAYWLIDGEGCNPSKNQEQNNSESDSESDTNSNSNSNSNSSNYAYEDYNGQRVVRIWRTPQFNTWYSTERMSLDGEIQNVEHFDSKCISYFGTKNEVSNEVTWASSNNSCQLVTDIQIADSSNGRDSADDLVLRFSAMISINSEVYAFKNHHVLAIGPTGRYNVTDSYVQIQNMFGERATDCAEGDTACQNKANANGGN